MHETLILDRPYSFGYDEANNVYVISYEVSDQRVED